jgi:mannopine transport system permease protein
VGQKPETALTARGVVPSRLVVLALRAPLLLLLGVFFVGAVLSLIGETLQNGPAAAVTSFQDVLSKNLVQTIALRTLRIAIVVTTLTLIIGYATAYAMWRSSPSIQMLLLALVMFPLFTSVVVRTYAWTTLLNRGGLINTILLNLGLIDEPLRLIKTEGAVLIGMVQVLLPFAILPIYTTLLRIDEDLLRASAIAGARGFQTFRKVVLPLSLQATMVAGVLVFVIALGFFVTPAILGGPQHSMISNLISTEVTTFLDLRDGAVISLALLVVTIAIIGFVAKVVSIGEHLRS